MTGSSTYTQYERRVHLDVSCSFWRVCTDTVRFQYKLAFLCWTQPQPDLMFTHALHLCRQRIARGEAAAWLFTLSPASCFTVYYLSMQAAWLSTTSSMQAKQDRKQHPRLQACLNSGVFKHRVRNNIIGQTGIVAASHALFLCQIQ